MKLIQLQQCEDADIRFDTTNSYWPTKLNKNDLFNHNFKLAIKVGNIKDTQKTIVVGALVKGTYYELMTGTIEANKEYTVSWKQNPPTIETFWKTLAKEDITKTETINFSWFVGYVVDPQKGAFCLTDKMDANILVEVTTPNIFKWAMIGGIAIAAIGIVYSASKLKK